MESDILMLVIKFIFFIFAPTRTTGCSFGEGAPYVRLNRMAKAYNRPRICANGNDTAHIN